jgi:hypothetical protein
MKLRRCGSPISKPLPGAGGADDAVRADFGRHLNGPTESSDALLNGKASSWSRALKIQFNPEGENHESRFVSDDGKTFPDIWKSSL